MIDRDYVLMGLDLVETFSGDVRNYLEQGRIPKTLEWKKLSGSDMDGMIVWVAKPTSWIEYFSTEITSCVWSCYLGIGEKHWVESDSCKSVEEGKRLAQQHFNKLSQGTTQSIV